MKKIYLISLLGSIIIFSTCNREVEVKNACVLDFKYEKHEAVGPEGLISIIRVDDRTLRNTLLDSDYLVFNYKGGIYDIDSLYFPSPMVYVYNEMDSTLVFGQGVFGLRHFTESFIDSVIQKTKNELVIDIIDSINNKKWTITNCILMKQRPK